MSASELRSDGDAQATRFTTVGRPRWIDAVIEVSAVGIATVGMTMPFVLVPRSVGGIAADVGLLVACVAVLGAAFVGGIYRFLHRPGASRGECMVGADGIRLSDRSGVRFYAYDEITMKRADEIQKCVWLTLTDGELAQFRVEAPKAVLAAIEAHAQKAEDRVQAEPVRSLSREKEGTAPWGKRARNLLKGSLREETMTQERLVELAEDPAAAPDQRVGAALALAAAPEPMRVRVRVAAEATARPHVAEAMTRAVDGEVDTTVLERALD